MVVYHIPHYKLGTQSGLDQISRAEGVMLYIPAGDSGLLYSEGVQIIDGVQHPHLVSDIFVYDIANVRWYKQTTSGAELPGSRSSEKKTACPNGLNRTRHSFVKISTLFDCAISLWLRCSFETYPPGKVDDRRCVPVAQ
jgi:hypothetical protein